MPRHPRLFAAFLIAVSLAAGAAHAQAVGTAQPAALQAMVATEQGWLDTAALDAFAVRDAVAARERRVAGAGEQIVYVVSRTAAGHRVLTVGEAFKRANPGAVERVVVAFEQARRWILANPEAAAESLARLDGVAPAVARERIAAGEFTTARPGPALAQALRAGANPAQLAVLDGLIDEAPIRAAARPSPANFASLRD